MMLILLLSCARPECDAGFKFNTDGLCVEDTAAADTDADTDSDSDTDSDTDSDSDTDTADSGDTVDSGDTAVASDWYTLGGEAAVASFVDVFLRRVGEDASINWMFANTDLAAFRLSLIHQISGATGGPYTYTGPDMVAVHKDMAITDDQFNALAGDLVGALDELSIPHSADFTGDNPADRLVTALAGMHDDIVTDPSGTVVLFNQLGGHPAVEMVVAEFVDNVAADSRVNTRFASTDLAKLKSLLVKQICAGTGGYCVYDGRSMVETHTGMNITEEEFTAVVEDLTDALDFLHVPYTNPDFSGGLPADQLMLTLAGMHDDIVGL